MNRDWLRYSLVFLTFLGVFSTYPKAIYQPVVAQTDPSNIINVSTAQEFQNINQNLAGHYVIGNDIDFLNFPFTPLAANANFTGSIEGGGFTLRNLTLTRPEIITVESFELGIIINNNGAIRNLKIEDIKIQSDNGDTFQTDDLNESRLLIMSYFVVYNFSNGIIDNVSLSLAAHRLIYQVTEATNAYALALTFAFFTFENQGLIRNASVLLDEDLQIHVQGGQRQLTLIASSIVHNIGTIDKFTFRMLPSHSPQPSVNALEIINAEAGALTSTIYLSFIAHENLGTITKTYATQLGKVSIDSHYRSNIFVTYFSMLNRGIIDEVYLNIEGDLITNSSVGLSSDRVEIIISYVAYINFNIGQISNMYGVIRGIIDYRMLRSITDHQLSWSGLVYENLGRIISFYNVGEVKIRLDVGAFNPSPQSTFFISRMTVKDSGSSVIRNGLTDLSIRMFMFTNPDSIKAREAKNSTTFYNTTTDAYTVINKVDIVSKHEDLFFGRRIADNATVFDDTIGTEKYVFDNTENYVIRNNADFIANLNPSVWFNASRFSTTFWSIDQREFYSNGPVLKSLTLFTFDLKHQTIYADGFEYEVPETFHVFMNGVQQSSGTYFFTGYAVHEFILESVVSGIKSKLSLIVVNDDINITNGGVYSGPIEPKILGVTNLTLNDQPYTSGTEITDPGVYTLVIEGINGYSQTISFTIELIKGGVSNGSTSSSPVTPTFSGGTAELNGQPFLSGTTITDVGIYELEITGVNNFVDTTTFTIAPVVTGLQNGLNYEGSVTPVITGSGMTIELNGNSYQSGTEITDPGVYTLVIEGLNAFEARYTFTISLQIANISNQAVYSDSVTPTFSGGTAELNGQPFLSGTTITDVGIYELEITGVNDFVSKTTFTIAPVVTGLAENGIYMAEADINIVGAGMTVTLNGSPFENGIVNEPGIHELTIEGKGGYRQVYSFTIQVIVSGVLSGERYINQSPTIRFTGGTATLNGVAISSEYAVTEVGHYRLLIERRNQEPYELTFSILPEISRLANDRTYSGSITPTINGKGMTVTLNGQAYVLGIAITNPGLNHMRITSQNGNFEQLITFTITLLVTGFELNEAHYDIVTPVFSGGTAILNDEPIVSNTPIRTYGNFQLIIRGVNDFERVMNFSISPYLINVPQENASASETNLVLTEIHSLTLITLNGEPFMESRLIKEVGIYDLVIAYDEDVIVDIQFVVEPQNYLLDGTVLSAPVVIDYPFSETRINGTLVEGPYRIDVQGEYTIEVQGVNGYLHRYSIRFVNDNITYVNQLLIPIASVMLMSFVAYFVRKWRIR
jgi:hypothetical protein